MQNLKTSPYLNNISRVATFVMSAFVIYMFTCSLLNFDMSWDFLAYHLPDILGIIGKTKYVTGPTLIAVNSGFPPLPHYLQAILVFLTGLFSAANLINFLGFFGVLVYAYKCLAFNRNQVLGLSALLLSTPHIIIHITKGYIDLWSNSLLALAFLEATLARNKKQTSFIFYAALAGAVLSKYQMWPPALIVTTIFFLRRTEFFKENVKALFKSLVVVGLILSFWPIRNIIYHNNPVYPIESPILKSHFSKHYFKTQSDISQTPAYLKDSPNSAKFFASVFEISRFTSPDRLAWSIDQGHRDGPESDHHRMGGWGLSTVLILLAILLLSIKRIPKSVSVSLIVLVAATSAFPQSHELRYWLYIPIVLAVFAMNYFSPQRRWIKAIAIGAIVLNFLYVVGKSGPRLRYAPIENYAPEEAKEFWKAAELQPPDTVHTLCKMPLTIFYAGKDFNSFHVSGCH